MSDQTTPRWRLDVRVAWGPLRRALAAVLMVLAVVLAGLGAHIVWGTGVALLVVAVCCAALALLLGWE